MNNSAYWKKRFEAIESSAVSKGASYYSTLEKEYLEASKRIEQEISTWYQRFAVNNEISLAEARKLLNSGELKEFKWTVQDYIKHGELNALDASWMKQLENASAKVHISRLEALKIQMQQQVEVLYGNQVDDIDKLAKRIYSDTYYHTAYEIQKGFNVGWDLPSFNDRQLEKVLSKPWTSDNMTFRDKCWKRKDELVATVQTQLTQGILRGDSPDKAIKAISDKFKVDKSKAGRLVMTESAYFAADAQKKCFTDLDVDKVEIVATLDSHTSEICQEMDGKIVDMKDYEPGVTVPPFHPWCRSTTVPYFPDNYGERAARNEKGETYYVPSDMTYKDWKQSFVGGGSKGSLKEIPSESKAKVQEAIKEFKFTPAKTIEEAEEYVSQYVDSNGFGALGVSYQGVSVDVANELNQTIGKFYDTFDVDKFGGIIAPKGNTKLGSQISGATAAYSPVRNSFLLNRSSLKDLKTAEKAFAAESETLNNVLNHPERYDFSKISKKVLDVVERAKVSGRATVPTSITDAINHELGHMIEKKVFKSDLWGEAEKAMLEYADKISGYAGYNKSEYVAESLASYLKGEDIIEPTLKAIFESLKRK